MSCHPSPDVVCYAHNATSGHPVVGVVVVFALLFFLAVVPALMAAAGFWKP